MPIFVSHASSDAGLADELVRELEGEGLSVGYPSESIFPGDNWSLARGNALQECDVMAALFSRASDATVLRDVQFALTSGKYRGRIVPVLIDFKTFTAGTEVPWIVLKLDPIYINSPDFDLTPVVKRLQAIADAGHHASA